MSSSSSVRAVERLAGQEQAGKQRSAGPARHASRTSWSKNAPDHCGTLLAEAVRRARSMASMAVFMSPRLKASSPSLPSIWALATSPVGEFARRLDLPGRLVVAAAQHEDVAQPLGDPIAGGLVGRRHRARRCDTAPRRSPASAASGPARRRPGRRAGRAAVRRRRRSGRPARRRARRLRLRDRRAA